MARTWRHTGRSREKIVEISTLAGREVIRFILVHSLVIPVSAIYSKAGALATVRFPVIYPSAGVRVMSSENVTVLGRAWVL